MKLSYLIIVIFILLNRANANGFLDYTAQHTFNCSSYKNLTNQDKRNYLYLHSIDRYSFLIMCPAIFCIQIFILMAFIIFKELRERPGDLFIGLIISMIVDNLHLLMTAIYDTIYKQNANDLPPDFNSFCKFNGFVSIISEVMQILYSIAFCLHICISLRTNLKYKRIQSKYIHLSFFITSIIVAFICYSLPQSLLGLNVYGVCSFILTSYMFPLLQTIISIIFVIIGYFSLKYFAKHMPETYGLRLKKYQQIRRYSLYIFGMSLISIIGAIITIIVIYNCINAVNPAMTILETFYNLLKLIEFLFLNYVIINSELMLKKIKKMYRQIFSKTRKNSTVSNQSNQQNNQQQMADLNLIDNYQYSIMQTLRISQVGTIVFGVQFRLLQSYNYAKTEIKQNYYKNHTINRLNASTLSDYNIAVKACPLMNILQSTVIAYAPRIFKDLMEMDGLKGVQNSFDLTNNYTNMFGTVKSDGGKSGEFFFFTFDNKYILKTVNQYQLNILLQYLPIFYEYYKKNPQSLLAKIYGLYTFKGDQIQRTFHVILMKNIIGCERDNVQRIYDMKGSSYDREVIKANKTYNYSQMRTMTLKDIDFKKHQGKIQINKSLTFKLKQTLNKDSLFLKSLNLIDYSLLVIKVKWQKQASTDITCFWNQLQRMPSIYEPGVFYHIGIIDYIQKWDIQKRSEKWWKTLFGAKDVSAQRPQIYHSRFVEFIDSIIDTVKQQKNQYE